MDKRITAFACGLLAASALIAPGAALARPASNVEARLDRLEAELTSVEYKHDANNAILLERKEDMKKRGLPSPDRGDALALTFAYPVTKLTDTWEQHRGPDGRSDATGY